MKIFYGTFITALIVALIFAQFAFSSVHNNDVEKLFNLLTSNNPDSLSEARTLIQSGTVDVNTVTKNGESLLHLACIYGNADNVRSLLQAGADPNFRSSKLPTSLDMTPLTWCCYGGYTEAVSAFLANTSGKTVGLQKSVEVNMVVRQEDGNYITALDIAYKTGEIGKDIVKLLENSGAKRYQSMSEIDKNNMLLMPPEPIIEKEL